METYFHFLKQDFKDSATHWLMGLVATIALMVCNGIWDISRAPFTPLYVFALSYALSSPAMASRRIIWGGSTPAPLSRAYLQTLPLGRSYVFWLGLARELLVHLPSVGFVVAANYRYNFLGKLAAQVRGYPILDRNAHLSESALCLAMMLILAWYGTLASPCHALLDERVGRATGRFRRLGLRFATLGSAVGLIGMGMAVDWTLFCVFYGLNLALPFWVVSFAALPLTLSIVFCAYRTWLEN